MDHAEDLQRRCYAAILAYLAGLDSEAATFAGTLPEMPAWREAPHVPLPAAVDLASCLTMAGDAARPLVEAILAAAFVLHWQQGYTEAEVGADYLARSGWCELAGPDGPLILPDARIFIAYWGADLDYQMHWHVPEELYLPLAGTGYFSAEGNAPRWAGPGDHVFHASNQRHATLMGPDGFLALILWRGDVVLDALVIAPREAGR